MSHKNGETAVYAATTPLCFVFFQCCVDVLQSRFSCSTINYMKKATWKQKGFFEGVDQIEGFYKCYYGQSESDHS